jgi:hypothetical protein
MRHSILRKLCLVCCAVTFVGLACQVASAQGGRQSAASRLQRPTVSPYLNLFRRGSNGMPNYQTLVRPELQQLKTNSFQQSEISNLRSQIVSEQQQRQTQAIPQTGHESRFREYSHFYPRKQRQQ